MLERWLVHRRKAHRGMISVCRKPPSIGCGRVVRVCRPLPIPHTDVACVVQITFKTNRLLKSREGHKADMHPCGSS